MKSVFVRRCSPCNKNVYKYFSAMFHLFFVICVNHCINVKVNLYSLTSNIFNSVFCSIPWHISASMSFPKPR